MSKNLLPLSFCPLRHNILEPIWKRLHVKYQKEDNFVAKNPFSVQLSTQQQCEECQCIKLCQYSQMKLYKKIHIENNISKKIQKRPLVPKMSEQSSSWDEEQEVSGKAEQRRGVIAARVLVVSLEVLQTRHLNFKLITT